MNKEKLEKNWTARGFSFGVGAIRAGGGINEAVHDNQDELVVMERGKYEFTVDNETFIQEGDAEVLILAGSIHSIKNLGSKDSKIYYGYKPVNV